MFVEAENISELDQEVLLNKLSETRYVTQLLKYV